MFNFLGWIIAKVLIFYLFIKENTYIYLKLLQKLKSFHGFINSCFTMIVDYLRGIIFIPAVLAQSSWEILIQKSLFKQTRRGGTES